jgi:DNA excision repair protein ERCC-2
MLMNLLFPFDEIRTVQKKFMKDIYTAVVSKKHLVAHAPTGIGKSAASISVALTYALEHGKNVIFLTPKHTQHQIVVETLKKIKEKFGVNIIATDFIGKKWMCMIPGVDNLTSRDFNELCGELRKDEKCSFYNGIWNKNKMTQKAEKILNELKIKSPLHVEEVVSICAKNEICPYYLSTELAKASNFIIADYYHLFHPSVRKSFLVRIKKELEDSIIIVDEAQNLPSRIRDVLSFKISTMTLNAAIKEARKFNYPDLANELGFVLDILEDYSKRLSEKENEIYVEKDDFVKEVTSRINRDYEEFYSDLILAGDYIRTENKRSFVGSIGMFLQEWINANEGYARIFRKSYWRDKEKFELDLKCLDPGISSKEVFDNCHSAILMSGTLTPTQMYRDLLRMEKERTMCKEYPSQFPRENQLSLIVPDTTTKFTRRNEEEFEKIADWCAKISNAIPGNVALFFPSYFLRDKVLKYFERKSTKTIFMEQQGMSKRERAKLLEDFKTYADIGAVFLAVVGGSFGEGVDLPGKFLNGVVVVGIPLDTPDLETRALIDYYDKLFGAAMRQTMMTLADSFSFTAMRTLPEHMTSRHMQMAGGHYVFYERRGSFSEKREVWLCSDGTALFKGTYATANETTRGTVVRRGNWQLEEDRLILALEQGQQERYTITQEHNTLYFDKAQTFRLPNNICK